MTAALTQGRSPINRPLSNVALPIVAGAPKVWAGARVYLDVAAAGIRPGIAGNPNLFFAGDAQETVDNSGGATTAPCMVRLPDELNCEWCDNSTANPVTAANLFGLCYVDSDHSVSSNPVGNSVAGRVWAIDTVLGVLVQPLMSILESFLGEEAPVGGNPAFKARAVITSIGAYGGSGTGVLTETAATGALGAQDGVTLAVGDVVLLQEGTTNITAAKDAGPYQITALGSGAAKWVLTRPSWWATGATIVSDSGIDIGEGAIWANTTWRATCVKGQVIDTNDALFYPDVVTLQVTLSGGTFAITTVPIRSASRSNVIPVYAGAGTPNAATLTYVPGVITPGPIGTATVTVSSVKAGMVAQGSDTSVLNVTIVNK